MKRKKVRQERYMVYESRRKEKDSDLRLSRANISFVAATIRVMELHTKGKASYVVRVSDGRIVVDRRDWMEAEGF